MADILRRIYSAMFWSLRSRWPDDGSAAFMLRLSISVVQTSSLIIVVETIFDFRMTLLALDGRWARIDMIILGTMLLYGILFIWGPSMEQITSIQESRRIRWPLATIGWVLVLAMFIGVPYIMSHFA